MNNNKLLNDILTASNNLQPGETAKAKIKSTTIDGQTSLRFVPEESRETVPGLTKGTVEDLAASSRKLKPGETITGDVKDVCVGHLRVSKFISTEVGSEEVLSGGFDFKGSITYPENDKVSKISGKINDLALKKEPKVKSKLNRGFFASLKKFMQETAAREDDLNEIYRDDLGRDYYLIDGVPTYIDERGFNYYLSCDENNRVWEWIKLEDGTTAKFIDPERTMIMVDGIVHPMDASGNIIYEEQIDYIGPRL